MDTFLTRVRNCHDDERFDKVLFDQAFWRFRPRSIPRLKKTSPHRKRFGRRANRALGKVVGRDADSRAANKPGRPVGFRESSTEIQGAV